MISYNEKMILVGTKIKETSSRYQLTVDSRMQLHTMDASSLRRSDNMKSTG